MHGYQHLHALVVLVTASVAASAISIELLAVPGSTGVHEIPLGRRGLRLTVRLQAADANLRDPRLQVAHSSISTLNSPGKTRPLQHPHAERHQHAPYVHVYFMAKNEQVLLPLAIQHYRTRFPGCRITVFDNNSTDNTVRIAQQARCDVIHRRTKDNIMDTYGAMHIRSTCWKTENTTRRDPPWVILADVDEWLDMWQEDLQAEDAKGAVIIKTMGVQIVGNSSSPTLSDVDVHGMRFGAVDELYSKHICFKRGPNGIKGITYSPGAHEASADPPDARFSSSCYVLKHMSALGRPFFEEKTLNRYWQSANIRPLGFGDHYTNNTKRILNRYAELSQSAIQHPYAPSASGHARLQCSNH